MEPKIKLWLEVDDEIVFGIGRLILLEKIDRLGSINKAANELNMSYRAAWGKIKASEERLGFKLVETKVGGSKGGGTELTSKAKKVMKKYQEYEELINQKVQKIFKNKFTDLF
ncbi:winged helix-turn-helix domain-containing protein [Selenihalanaerobacter shriftii]|uniref:Molybdate transport system regulatory protein n=1 Tax=Selenihalanaerobacter shriftii TaxID=142842 RepID=A0A1T4PAM3_9FIRM|nr:LysR family transcriptional regulator [Selenihalanaerobacter shriftii]SJZ88552.1 molybdate transport system regulatory protein [Selenihalanaerobacter shriftii]